MEKLKKLLVWPIVTDCTDSVQPALGYYIGKTTLAPYGLYEMFPPIHVDGRYITYSKGALSVDNSSIAQAGNIIWTFTVWNLQTGIQAEPIKQRLFTLLEDKIFTGIDGYIGNIKCVNRGQNIFEEKRNSYFCRMQFDSYVRINTKAG